MPEENSRVKQVREIIQNLENTKASRFDEVPLVVLNNCIYSHLDSSLSGIYRQFNFSYRLEGCSIVPVPRKETQKLIKDTNFPQHKSIELYGECQVAAVDVFKEFDELYHTALLDKFPIHDLASKSCPSFAVDGLNLIFNQSVSELFKVPYLPLFFIY